MVLHLQLHFLVAVTLAVIAESTIEINRDSSLLQFRMNVSQTMVAIITTG